MNWFLGTMNVLRLELVHLEAESLFQRVMVHRSERRGRTLSEILREAGMQVPSVGCHLVAGLDAAFAAFEILGRRDDPAKGLLDVVAQCLLIGNAQRHIWRAAERIFIATAN